MNSISPAYIQHTPELRPTAVQHPDKAEERSGPQPAEAEDTQLQEADRFVHADTASPGKYWVEPGENGPSVRFDAPREAASPAEKPALSTSRDPEPAPEEDADRNGKPAQTTTCNTDQVDQEIEMLRRRTASLKQDLLSAGSEEEAAQSEKELAAAERELALKDNDAYRRAHAHFS